MWTDNFPPLHDISNMPTLLFLLCWCILFVVFTTCLLWACLVRVSIVLLQWQWADTKHKQGIDSMYNCWSLPKRCVNGNVNRITQTLARYISHYQNIILCPSVWFPAPLCYKFLLTCNIHVCCPPNTSMIMCTSNGFGTKKMWKMDILRNSNRFHWVHSVIYSLTNMCHSKG